MKIIITESKIEKAAINWLNKNYGDLKPYDSIKYPDIIFYKNDDGVILQYNKKTGVVFISYDEIWSFLESFFGMEYLQIQGLTKRWVEEHYNLRVTTMFLLQSGYF